VAKRKLSQNRSGEVVETIIAELSADGAHPNPTLAAEMRRARDAQVAAAAEGAHP
jgi:transcriptional regulator